MQPLTLITRNIPLTHIISCSDKELRLHKTETLESPVLWILITHTLNRCTAMSILKHSLIFQFYFPQCLYFSKSVYPTKSDLSTHKHNTSKNTHDLSRQSSAGDDIVPTFLLVECVLIRWPVLYSLNPLMAR